MTFKLSHIATAAGLAVVAASALANPTSPNRDPNQYSSGTTDVYLAGSSAVDLALTKFIANTCNAASLDTYRTDAGGKTYYLWTCETTGSTGFGVANTKIAIHKNTNSSSDGVNMVTNGAGTLAYLQVSDLTTAASQCAVAPSVVAATATIPTYNVYTCGTTAGNAGVGSLGHTVRFGFADSEPAQFNSAVTTQLTTAYPLTIVFGIPVTKNVRDLLQTAQGLTAGSEVESQMPSLTSGQINEIYTGNFQDWGSLGITLPGDNSVYVARRSNGSGTTRAFDVNFAGDFCTPGQSPIVTGSAITAVATTCNSTANGGKLVAQAGTSDDMAACLASYQQNGGVGAIGYLSTDYLPGTGDFYRWVKVDGYAPKLLNVVDNKWKDWSEESINYNKATTLVATSDDGKFYAALKTFSSNITLLSEVAKNLPQTTSGQWTGGVLSAMAGGANKAGWGVTPAAAQQAAPRSDASVLAAPVNLSTRSGSSGYNLCNIPQTTYGTVAE